MRKKIFVILAGVMMIALTLSGVVYAREIIDLELNDESEMEYEVVEGTFKEIEGDLLTVTVDGVDYEFRIVEDYKIKDEIEVGDYVKVKYYVDGDDDDGYQFILIEVELEDEDEDDMYDDDMESGAVCSGDLEHPVLSELADSYGVAYDTLKDYFCQGFGVGEIMLALRTAEQLDLTELDEAEKTFEDILEDILKERFTDDNGMKDVGWGEIWQELGLIGKGKQDNEETEPEAMKNKHQEEFQFEGEEQQFENEAKRQDKNNNKPSTPPGQSGNNPGKGKGPGN